MKNVKIIGHRLLKFGSFIRGILLRLAIVSIDCIEFVISDVSFIFLVCAKTAIYDFDLINDLSYDEFCYQNAPSVKDDHLTALVVTGFIFFWK